ncbi:MAG: ABC transporter substrate binding protein [Pseudomonadota bacterium]
MEVIKYNKNKHQSQSRVVVLVTMVWLALSTSCIALAETQRIAVLYPDISPPYRDVFLDIIKGIEDVAKDSVKIFDIKKDFDEKLLRHDLEEAQIDVVIALGNRGLNAARKLPNVFDVVVGAVFLTPDNKSDVSAGISLNPDPEILFRQLKELAPRVRRVSVVYNPEHSGWLIERAEKAAKQSALSLNAMPARNLKEAAALYRDLIRDADSSQAFWLLQDSSILDQRVILAMILKKAWDKQFVVFSGNPGHVRKGALFSLYPDNIGMGRSLGSIAINRFQTDKRKDETVPVRDLLIAVNTRTAKRMNLKFINAIRREFDLVFPTK